MNYITIVWLSFASQTIAVPQNQTYDLSPSNISVPIVGDNDLNPSNTAVPIAEDNDLNPSNMISAPIFGDNSTELMKANTNNTVAANVSVPVYHTPSPSALVIENVIPQIPGHKQPPRVKAMRNSASILSNTPAAVITAFSFIILQ